MSVILQRTDPLSAASDAVGSFYDAKRKKQLEDAALAHQTARENRQDLESDRSYGLEQGRFGIEQNRFGLEKNADNRAQSLLPGEITAQTDAHAGAAASLTGTNLDNAYKQIQNKYAKINAALDAEQKRLENLLKQKQITSADAALKLAEINNRRAQFSADHDAENQALTVAQTHASIAASQASANASNASAWRTRNEPFYNPNGATDAYTSALSSLSPAATAFIQNLQKSGASMTPIQAELSVRAPSGLSPADKKAVMTVLQGSSTSDFQPLTGKPPHDTKDTSHIQEYNAIAKGKLFDTLTPRLRDVVRHWMVDSKLSVNEIISSLPTSQVSDPDKQAISRALGAQ